uniref:ARAD1D38258p n=1 Tax=Blastobotrys adeninivorans TaxID=409370 RepID=A0A060TBY1_BLAAD
MTGNDLVWPRKIWNCPRDQKWQPCRRLSNFTAKVYINTPVLVVVGIELLSITMSLRSLRIINPLRAVRFSPYRIAYRDPFPELSPWHNTDSRFDSLIPSFPNFNHRVDSEWSPEIFDKDDHMEVVTTLPKDVDPESVKVNFDSKQGTLSLFSSTEKRSEDGSFYSSSSFSRTISVPSLNQLGSGLSTRFEDGKFTVSVPKNPNTSTESAKTEGAQSDHSNSN